MHPLESIPAVRRLDTSNDRVFAVEIRGHASAADVENFYGLLEGAYTLHDDIDLFVRFVDCDGVDWGDVDRNTTREGRSHAHDHILRCAIVGPPERSRELRDFLALGDREVQEFPPEQEAEAWRWFHASEIVAKV